MKNIQLFCYCFLVFLTKLVLSHNCSFLDLSFLFTQQSLQKWHVGISLYYLIKIQGYQELNSAILKNTVFLGVKEVKEFHNVPDVPQRVPGVLGSQISMTFGILTF